MATSSSPTSPVGRGAGSPALVARMRTGEPELMPAEFASVKLRRSQAGRLFRVRLRGGEAASVYCHIEHTSAHPEVGLQLLGFLAELLRRLSEKPELCTGPFAGCVP